MDKVKKLLRAGASLSTALRAALDMSVAAFAAKHGLPRTMVNSQFTGRIAFSDPVINALIAELGGDAAGWRALQHSSRATAHAA